MLETGDNIVTIQQVNDLLCMYLADKTSFAINNLCETSEYEWVIQQDFCQQMLNGTLPLPKFKTFIAQDAIYLQHFNICHQQLFNKAKHEGIRQFLQKSIVNAVEAEQRTRPSDRQAEIPVANLITDAYCEHLHLACQHQNIYVGLISLLPCYWLYAQWASEYFQRYEKADHPYHEFFGLYRTIDLMQTARELQQLIVAGWHDAKANLPDLGKAYYSSCFYEHHFFVGRV